MYLIPVYAPAHAEKTEGHIQDVKGQISQISL